jgi:poly(A) polymerase
MTLTSETLPSLAGAGWLREGAAPRIFELLETAGEQVRVVGGAVRNALMGMPIPDFDFATTATPGKVTALAESAGLKAVPTGFDHGTVTIVVAGRGFEVTTLRQDIETDGRRARVRFGHDWTADALRRDFTMNALSVDSAGTVHDPAGGYPDIVARRVRFIGDADRRIAEDRLRILRFFRFHAEYGAGTLDPAGLSSVARAYRGLRDLSVERIGQEMRKLLVAPRAAEVVVVMQEIGVLPLVLAGVGRLDAFIRLAAFEALSSATPSFARRMAVLGCRIEEDVSRIAERLRLTNSERDSMMAIVANVGTVDRPPDAKMARRLLYTHGVELYRNLIATAFAVHGGADAAWLGAFKAAERWAIPKFPLGGNDVLAGGLDGPVVGELLRSVEAWWIDEDFGPDEQALRARLHQMMVAAQ